MYSYSATSLEQTLMDVRGGKKDGHWFINSLLNCFSLVSNRVLDDFSNLITSNYFIK